MLCKFSRRHPRGITLTELVVVIVCFFFLIGLLLPGCQKAAQDGYPRAMSQNNLKQIALAINNFATVNNNKLPNAGAHARYWFCGTTEVAGVVEPSPAPNFDGGILSMMEGNPKALVAMLDVNAPQASPFACSYSIPAYWATITQGDLVFPTSFPRGTSNCIGSAEMTSFGVTYNNIRPFRDARYGLAIDGVGSSTATAFTQSGLQVVMLDGSVHIVSLAANNAGKWVFSCHPDDTTNAVNTDW